jgi:Spx/MgsR family transcriptional regulator
MPELSPSPQALGVLGHDSGMTPATPITIYGIPNCDSVKKARVWLSEQHIDYTFHDFKKQGVPEAALDHWLTQVSWETLLNRKGTTWRKLDEATQNSISDAASAKQLMLAQASVIKRPVWVCGQHVIVGVNPQAWSRVLN